MSDFVKLIVCLFLASVVVSLIVLLFVWEWNLIRDVAIAFMPLYSAEALAWLGILFNFWFVGKGFYVNYKIVNKGED